MSSGDMNRCGSVIFRSVGEFPATTITSFLLLTLFPTSLSSSSSSSSSSSPHNSFCSAYSHNHRSSMIAKDYFACCANSEEEPCHGLTYQKPSRSEGFCRGQIINDHSQHWTQQETELGYHGYFYCGGCCGQHLASDGCNDEWKKSAAAAAGETGGGGGAGTCFNWVVCFIRRCQKINEDIAVGRHLGCSVPPPPYPKHYIEETRTLPPNYSSLFHHVTKSQGQGWSGCGEKECRSLRMEERCQTDCCRSFCCLPDGSLGVGGVGARGRSAFVGLSVVQMLSVVGAMIAFVVLVVGLSVCLAKRCTKFDAEAVPHDSRILVIEEHDDQNDDSDVESL